MLKFLHAFAFSSTLIESTALAEVPRSQPDQALQQLARQLEPYKNVNFALNNGYRRANPHCEFSRNGLGAMGIHYVRGDLLGLPPGPPVPGQRINGTGTYTGVNPPAILLYVDDAATSGGKRLVGIELLVFAEAWHAANKQPPKYRGREYNYMADNPATQVDEAHNFMPHYDLHIWLFEHNPSGLYAQWNPALSCSTAGQFHVRHVGSQ